MPKVGKLVRNKVPRLITESGRRPTTQTVPKKDQLAVLLAKLEEECRELSADPGVDELVDVLEILARISSQLEIPAQSILTALRQKRQTHGSFSESVWLEAVSEYTR